MTGANALDLTWQDPAGRVQGRRANAAVFLAEAALPGQVAPDDPTVARTPGLPAADAAEALGHVACVPRTSRQIELGAAADVEGMDVEGMNMDHEVVG